MKKKVIIALSLLMICMSSCVYSLFPIYTEDTIVFLPELQGKWQTPGEEGDYIEFKSYFGTTNSMTISIDMDENVEETVKLSGFGQREYTLEEIRDKIVASEDTLITLNGNELTTSMFTPLNMEKMNYRMSVHKDGEVTEEYEVYVVRIGDNLFLDLYPYENMNFAGISDNYFPVHTFMRLDMGENKFDMVMFDLDKMNKLFKSNLIRMRHENVDGTILITAQPKEIQKFLSKYANDESVYDETATYKRIVSQ